MKPMKKISYFLEREWFLVITVSVLLVIIFLFEVIW